MNIIRKKLDPAEISNPSYRYDSECDCVQYTPDGGTTWVDAPQSDPRTSLAYQIPAVASSDPRCDAASALVANFQEGLTGTLNAISATSTAVGGASFILTFLDFLTGIGLLVQLFIDFCALIISIGVSAIEADFTSTVYEDLKCRVYCNVQADGTFTQDNLNAIELSVRNFYGEFSTIAVIFTAWLENLGYVGMSNVASAKHIVGDCSACATCDWCVHISGDQLLALAWTWLAGYSQQGIWDNVNKHWHTVNVGRSVLYWLASFHLDTGSTLTKIIMEWNTTGDPNTDSVTKTFGYVASASLAYGDPATGLSFTQYVQQTTFNTRPLLELDLSTPATGDFVLAGGIDANTGRNDLYVYGFYMYGTGAPPSGLTANCS